MVGSKDPIFPKCPHGLAECMTCSGVVPDPGEPPSALHQPPHMTIEELKQMPIVTVEQVLRFREAALKEIKECHEIMREANRLLCNGADGSIVDTVWSDSAPNTTLHELMCMHTGEVT